jgi:hypothetical protein
MGQHPEQFQLPFDPRKRRAVRELVENHFGGDMGLWTVGREPEAWRFRRQTPVRQSAC